MRRLWMVCAVAGQILASGTAAALEVRFEEGAPKDRFVVVNDGVCPLGPMTVVIDLEGGQGGLVFDTTAAGAGVAVYQPLEVVEATRLRSVSSIADGDRRLVLELDGLGPDERVVLTVDVDDTLPASRFGQTRIAGEEIAGATVQATDAIGRTRTATFDAGAAARIEAADCATS